MTRHPLRHTMDNDSFVDVEKIPSATECTGLMPTMVETDDEAENLCRLEGIHPIKVQRK